MANTTFSGPVRSENGFDMITKNATTGAVTANASYDKGIRGGVQTLSGAGAVDLVNLITEITTTCLLYTSPSPRDLSTSRMPSSA